MRNRIKVFDLLIAILFFSLILLSFPKIKGKGDLLKVDANNREYLFSLSEDGIYKVKGLLGDTTIEIKNKRVRFIDSACPNKTCISQGYQDTLVCLPNKVIATITAEEGDVDAISR